jgi:vitamin B12 transporter
MNKFIFGFFALLLTCVHVKGQVLSIDSTRVEHLDEVVLIDSRFELKRENSGKMVIKIDSVELKRSQGMSVAEIINTKSGIEINGSRSVQGSVLGVFARGGRGRQVLILIDGVRATDPSSFSAEYDLRLLSSANIASIEIIKGAASTLYGTNAATAVIKITTKKAVSKDFGISISSSVGTNQTVENQNFNVAEFSNNARVSGVLNKVDYSLSIAQNYADGISAIITPNSEEDVFSNTSIDLRLGYKFNDKFDFSVYGNQTKMKTDFDESFGLIDADYQFLSSQERVGLSGNFKYDEKGSLHLNGAFTSYESESKSAFPNTFIGENLVLDLYHKYTFDSKLYTIVGLNYLKDETQFAETEAFTITDPYVNAVYVSDFGLNLNAGSRLNNHSTYGTNLVFNINPSYVFQVKTGYFKLLASYATSYITPSLTQLFGNFGANAELKPEDNRTIEGGFEYALSNEFRIGGVYFNRKEENFVFFDVLNNRYQNATNTIDAQGMELELKWMPSSQLSIDANYTFTERKGDNAIRLPKHKLNFNLNYTLSDKLNAALRYRWVGERTDTDFSAFPFVDQSLEPFSLVDVYAGFELMPQLTVFLNASNLLNKSYTEVLGFTTRGRNIRIGFNLNL